jgi:hypothetical protein
VYFTKYYDDDQIKDEMGRACSMYKRDENAYSILIEKPEWKRPLGRPGHGKIILE